MKKLSFKYTTDYTTAYSKYCPFVIKLTINSNETGVRYTPEVIEDCIWQFGSSFPEYIAEFLISELKEKVILTIDEEIDFTMSIRENIISDYHRYIKED